MKKSILYIFQFFLFSCAGLSHNNQKSPPRDVAKVPIESKKTTLYSWTNSPLAFEKPAQYLQQQLDFAKNCLQKMQKKNPVPECEGNQLYAGPGLYAVDNPFTSYDYGNNLIMVESLAGKRNFANAPSEGFASGGVNRKLVVNTANSAIIYDFRASDLNSKAVVIRNPDILNPTVHSSISLATQGYKKFSEHPAYRCTSQTSVEEVLTNWGDQMGFLVLSSMGGSENGSLNELAYLAAFASDAVAISDHELDAMINSLKVKYPELMNESLDPMACQETSSLSPRACLAQRIFNSARGELGFGDKTTYAWKTQDALQVFQFLKLLSDQEVKNIETPEQLSEAIINRMKKETTQIQNAFDCMNIVKQKAADSHLGLWVNE